ncbi:Mitochondrial import inner membrane translocase subunit PAM16 like 2 [Vitis vinifera]|uniref:Mitochondrial import inner membrane translocase subunit PAM16 like 2 n=1 Tax=Vitis vinifera TaxID=29760 RepID=A0A438FTF7_VITVI|nr:Mitochondrial import inner membrane translocase subunit PAM16 like 2 [Vitis vinifera]
MEKILQESQMASAKYKEIRKGHERVGEMLASGSNCDASKSGVAQETIQNTVRRGSKAMMEQEARQILGVTEQSTWEEILQAISMILCLKGMPRMGVFTFSQKFTGLKNV